MKKIINKVYKSLNSIILMNKKMLVELKEILFSYLYLYGYFDLNLMMNINIIFNKLILECEQ